MTTPVKLINVGELLDKLPPYVFWVILAWLAVLGTLVMFALIKYIFTGNDRYVHYDDDYDDDDGDFT